MLAQLTKSVGLSLMVKRIALDILPEVKGMTLKPCVDCLAGKQHRVAFCTPTTPHHANDILDLVHTDVCSMIENSLSGALYFVTFIDDHSRKVFAYVLKDKYQVCDAFKEFHAMVERETDQTMVVSIEDHLKDTVECMVTGNRRQCRR